MEKQIEQLAKDMPNYITSYNGSPIKQHFYIEQRIEVAEVLIKQGYRKQVEAEWVVQWCDNNLLGHEVAECSNCSCMYLDTEKTFKSYYCPNCGAKMKGE